MEALDRRYESEIDPIVIAISLRPSRFVWAYLWLALLGLTAALNNPNRGYNPPPAIHPPHHSLHSPHPVIHVTSNVVVAV